MSKKRRYFATEKWDNSKPIVNFITLYPKENHTNQKRSAKEYCMKNGFGGYYLTYLFTKILPNKPSLMIVDQIRPQGRKCDHFILDCSQKSDKTIICWGVNGKIKRRGPKVIGLLAENGVETYFSEGEHYPTGLEYIKPGDKLKQLKL